MKPWKGDGNHSGEGFRRPSRASFCFPSVPGVSLGLWPALHPWLPSDAAPWLRKSIQRSRVTPPITITIAVTIPVAVVAPAAAVAASALVTRIAPRAQLRQRGRRQQAHFVAVVVE